MINDILIRFSENEIIGAFSDWKESLDATDEDIMEFAVDAKMWRLFDMLSTKISVNFNNSQLLREALKTSNYEVVTQIVARGGNLQCLTPYVDALNCTEESIVDFVEEFGRPDIATELLKLRLISHSATTIKIEVLEYSAWPRFMKCAHNLDTLQNYKDVMAMIDDNEFTECIADYKMHKKLILASRLWVQGSIFFITYQYDDKNDPGFLSPHSERFGLIWCDLPNSIYYNRMDMFGVDELKSLTAIMTEFKTRTLL